jgi:2-polyprenyl-3-methyl-5-hydroxy-6-metoxy-1,4-benzoquinol methylase
LIIDHCSLVTEPKTISALNPDFWNERFVQNTQMYGEAPNAFLAEELAKLQPGRILFPAEGQGRNALYAARKGWTVEAFDYSEVGRDQAMAKAEAQGLSLVYRLESHTEFTAPAATYDAVALIFAHLPPELRSAVHGKLARSLKPGGTLILQGFHKRQLPLASGGPKNEAMLFSLEEMERDFGTYLNFERLEAQQETLEEGPFHQGQAEVVKVVGKRKED